MKPIKTCLHGNLRTTPAMPPPQETRPKMVGEVEIEQNVGWVTPPFFFLVV